MRYEIREHLICLKGKLVGIKMKKIQIEGKSYRGFMQPSWDRDIVNWWMKVTNWGIISGNRRTDQLWCSKFNCFLINAGTSHFNAKISNNFRVPLRFETYGVWNYTILDWTKNCTTSRAQPSTIFDLHVFFIYWGNGTNALA